MIFLKKKVPRIKFNGHSSSGGHADVCGQTGSQRDGHGADERRFSWLRKHDWNTQFRAQLRKAYFFI